MSPLTLKSLNPDPEKEPEPDAIEEVQAQTIDPTLAANAALIPAEGE
jgi:hypothetical protein